MYYCLLLLLVGIQIIHGRDTILEVFTTTTICRVGRVSLQ